MQAREQIERDDWFEATIEDTKTAVPEQAAFRCDFPEWLGTHDSRKRRIAEALAMGNSTREVARQFGVSPGRISQLRAEFKDSWQRFHGEEVAPTVGEVRRVVSRSA